MSRLFTTPEEAEAAFYEPIEQADMVRLAGCDQIQGWLYYKALPAAEIDSLIDAQVLELAQEANEPGAHKSISSGGYAA